MAVFTNRAFPSRCRCLAGRSINLEASVFQTNAGPWVPAVVGCLEEKVPGVPKEAAELLGQWALDESIAVPALGKCLCASSEDLRSAAACALGEFGKKSQDAVPALIIALNDPAPSVRIAARNAIMRIAPEMFETNAVNGGK